MEDAIEKFAVFGGVGWGKIDTSKPISELVEKLIFDDFRYIRNDINELTSGMPLYHAILSGIALGDAQMHSAFKRANVSYEVGAKAVDELCEMGIIKVEKSKKIFKNWDNHESVSNKLYFTSPFLRFWFAFVSPIFKGIRDGNYDEAQMMLQNRFLEYLHLPFTQLSYELVRLDFHEDRVVEIGTYWDKKFSLDIYGKTKSGKVIVGTTKYTNNKIKKSELTKLKELCNEAEIEADIFVFVAKKGYTTELKSLKGDSLKLYGVKNFKKLL